jgi:DHA2 family multidrug resistance protein
MPMVLGNFMAVLDIQIVGSSINELQAGLSASADEIQWVQTAYLIAEIIAIPLSGYLARMLSTRVYYTIATLGFTLASLMCAFSWNLSSMIVFRALQGFLGGGLVPTAFSGLYLIFPPEKRGNAVALIGMTTMLAPSIGPTIGGYLTAATSWHWLFLINIGPGLLAAYSTWNWVNIDRPHPEMLKQTDLPGFALMAVFLGCFEYSLDEGPRHDWFSDSSIAVCTVLSMVSGAAFFRRTLSSRHPIVDLYAFRNRNFAIGSLIAAVIGLTVYSMMYLTPVFLGQVRLYNPLQIGHIMMVQGITMMIVAPLVGWLGRFVEPRLLMGFGLIALTFGCWANSYMTAEWGFDQYVLPLFLRGMGVICCYIPMTDLALGTLPPEELKDASGLYNVMRNIGGAIGLALVTEIMNQRNWLHWQQLAEATSMSRESVREALGGLGSALHPALGDYSQAGAIGMLAHEAMQQVMTMTFNDMNFLLTLSLASTLPLLLLIAKPKMHVEGEGIH